MTEKFNIPTKLDFEILSEDHGEIDKNTSLEQMFSITLYGTLTCSEEELLEMADTLECWAETIKEKYNARTGLSPYYRPPGKINNCEVDIFDMPKDGIYIPGMTQVRRRLEK